MKGSESVNPEILVWAREKAALSVVDAAKKLAISADSLRALEAGEKRPSRQQVEKLSGVYRRSSIIFYLDSPPAASPALQDFRSKKSNLHPSQVAWMDALVRDVKVKQAILKTVLEEQDEAHPLDFVSSMTMNDGVDAVVASMAVHLQIKPGSKFKKAADLFKKLRSRTEKLGVFVLLISDLGSYHTALEPSVFRGFAVADPIAPMIVINDRDASVARPFTLLHELAHIWIGQSGISGPMVVPRSALATAKIEDFCNDVAAAFLLPAEAFIAAPKVSDVSHARRLVTQIAEEYSVSEPMVAYNARRHKVISSPAYKALMAEYAARWKAAKANKKAVEEKDSGGPHAYVLKRAKLGEAIVSLVRRGVDDGILSATKAAKVLGLKPTAVETFIREGYLTRNYLTMNIQNTA